MVNADSKNIDENIKNIEIAETDNTEISDNTSKEMKKNQNSQENGKKSKKIRKMRRKKPVLVASLIVAFLMLGNSLSWYLFSKDTHTDRPDIEVMTPYFLYLLNPEDNSSLSFSVGNIYPDETKRIVICVSNEMPSDYETDEENKSVTVARTSDFTYDLEFIYTENIAVNYKIYELEDITKDKEADTITEEEVSEGIAAGTIVAVDRSEGDLNDLYFRKKKNIEDNMVPLVKSADETQNRWDSVLTSGGEGVLETNKGQYDLYQKDSIGNDLLLSYDGTNYDHDYYMIEITWKDEVKTFSDYTKETDLLYVVVNAKQPKPQKTAMTSGGSTP